jgi:hypothetical protein
MQNNNTTHADLSLDSLTDGLIFAAITASMSVARYRSFLARSLTKFPRPRVYLAPVSLLKSLHEKKGALRRLKIGNGIRSIPGSNLQLIFRPGNSTKINKIANVTDFN